MYDKCISELTPSGSTFTCRNCPDYDCPNRMGNGLFKLSVELQGPVNSPPFVARLYLRKGRLGRFRIQLQEKRNQNLNILYGTLNVRYGDIIEWSNNGVRSLGIIDENGGLIKFDMLYSCVLFHESLKNYLTSRKIRHIIRYIALEKEKKFHADKKG